MNHWAQPLSSRTVTSGEVFARLNAMRMSGLFLCVDSDDPFSERMPFDEWMFLVGWDEICSCEELNYAFGVNLTDLDWREACETGGKTLGEICTWVADNHPQEYVQPLRIAGTESYEAGLFLAILNLMERVGVGTCGIKPSDSVTPWFVDHGQNIMPEFRKLFLLQLPEPTQVQHPLTRAGNSLCLRECLFLVGAGIAAVVVEALEVLLTSLGSLAFGYLSRLIGEYLQPSYTCFAEEMTFADLARHIAAAEARTASRF